MGITFKGSDTKQIHAYKWLPESQVKGVLQVAHGMAEHAMRYENFAKFLNANGYALYANDHRGHGKTAGSIEKLGYFADKNGWDLVVEDMYVLTQKIKEDLPSTPVFLLGHSMGSFLSRDYISKYGNELEGVILSATAGDPKLLGKLGVFVAKMQSLIQGKKNFSNLLDKLSFGEFNKSFKPNRTAFDWLSRDENEVDKYVNDPYCGTVFTSSFFVDLLSGILKINQIDCIQKVPKNLAVYFIAGEKDPVGDFTKGVSEVFHKFQKVGIEDVTRKFYLGARHEILNETNREEVYQNILTWMEEHQN
jgi:alpha-beta hydrolase superfamily lysophospholipase